ncbi:transmembrane protein 223-like [Asterias amurensis]|uniref:transmembrane protein 223-like n=1 Tax=Asterias amurensis TaxID=7602 RepID=UPI003AB2031A
MIIGRAQILLSGRNLRCIGISISSRTLQSSHQTFKLCVNGRIYANRRAQCFATLTRKPINLAKETVDKNILIYRNDRLRFFRILGIFALAQVGFWSYMTFNAYTTMTDSRNFEMVKYGPEGAPPEKKNWASLTGIRMKLHSGIWRYVVTSICFVVGGTIFCGAWLYCRKNIHRIVLRKGGTKVTISTFGFFGQQWSFTTPITNISCQHSRHGVRTQLPIKVKGHRFFYVLDKEGKMYNAPLFDQTVGVMRGLL